MQEGARRHAEGDQAPKIDCFYVYPTVSDQETPFATLSIDPELRSIALYQAARYSQRCRVFAPVYRQATVAGLGGARGTSAEAERAYTDVRSAWRTYLRKYNKGRGVVIMGHSQGTFVLRRMVREEVDPKPKVRRKLVSAILLGGNVTVRKGKDVGGDFKHIRACRSKRQTRLRDRVLGLQRAGARGRGVRANGRPEAPGALHQPGGAGRRHGPGHPHQPE